MIVPSLGPHNSELPLLGTHQKDKSSSHPPRRRNTIECDQGFTYVEKNISSQ